MNNLTVLTYNNERILTTKQIAEVYETQEHNIAKNFNENKDKFIEGKHYYKLVGEDLKEFKLQVTDSDLQISNMTRSLILWTERGANRHCKILDTNKAWDQFDMLEETYFNVRENKPQLPSYVEALRQLADTLEEKEKLEEENKELLPKAEAYDAFLNEEGLISMGDLAKIIGYGRNTFMKMLKKDEILMSSNIPYQRYIDYFEVKVVRKNGEDYKCSLANKKGLDFLTKKYMRKVKKPCIKK